MLALALSTLFSAGFGLMIRLAQGMGSNLTAVGAVNYLTATAVNAAILAIGGSKPPHPSTIAIGLVGGALYASAFFPVFALTRLRGASVTAAVTRMSALVPVAFSLFAWGERLTSLQGAGAAVALVSLPLLTLGRGAGAATEQGAGSAAAAGTAAAGGSRGTLLILGLFVMNGLCLLTTRVYRQTAVAGEEAAFLTILFASAATTACTVWTIRERRARSRAPQAAEGRPAPHSLALDVAPGVVIGASNALANRFIVLALERLPGSVVYPFYSAVGLLVTVIVSRLAWRERFGAGGALGLALAGASIVLVNLG